MRAITYKNNKTTLPRWTNTLHIDQPRGVAYETDTHFVHFYCADSGWYVLSAGLTVIQKKDGKLRDWAERTFGATDILNVANEVGVGKKGLWRPGVYHDSEFFEAIGTSNSTKYAALISLRILLEKLEDLFRYIEPDEAGLNVYGHKPRELLILACTEVENQWHEYMKENEVVANRRKYTTQDYVRLRDPLHLTEFKLQLKPYSAIGDIFPFLGWDNYSPTQSLRWYNAYNLTKHDRNQHFNQATVKNCIMQFVRALVFFVLAIVLMHWFVK